MNRIVRMLRSRFFWAALCIGLEFLQLLAVFILFYKHFFPFAVMAWIFHVGVLLYMLNRDEIPELKLPWMTLLFLFPVVGAFIYILLSSNDATKKECQRFDAANRCISPYMRQSRALDALKDRSMDAYAQANYLFHVAGMPCHDGTQAAYFAEGEAFHAALLRDLSHAKRFILMEYFIVQEGRMWDPIHSILREKAAAGVEVYFMYDNFGCMSTLPERYDALLRSEGIHCIPSNRFTPVLSHIHNNRDHRKITVIDGTIGYTGGLNLADEYINAVRRFGHWKDTAVRLEGRAVRNLTGLFIINWNMQHKEPLDGAPYFDVPDAFPPGGGFVIPFGDGPEPLYAEHIGKGVYLNMICDAKAYLYVTTPYLICDHELTNALRMAAQRGVDVRLITPHIPDKKAVFLMTRSSYRTLLDAGVRIYEYTPGFIHAKNVICDDQFAICGTINLDYRSLVHHFECAAWMYGTACIQDMKTDFLHTLAQSEEITPDRAALRLWQRLPAEIMKILSPLL
ncbi:MAG: cardiolipin synthase [Clostridia bacterium]|nr:cardiolipin synthase [Clostridia bacterium]